MQKRGNLLVIVVIIRSNNIKHTKNYNYEILYFKKNNQLHKHDIKARQNNDTYLREFYSIPNSPRGGKRENGSTLLQTVLH